MVTVVTIAKIKARNYLLITSTNQQRLSKILEIYLQIIKKKDELIISINTKLPLVIIFLYKITNYNSHTYGPQTSNNPNIKQRITAVQSQ